MPLDEIIVPTKTAAQSLELHREGTRIIVPDGVTLKSADEETKVEIVEDFGCHPADGAIAVGKALIEIFGQPNTASLPGFFGPKPPSFISVEVAPNKSIQVLWGGFKVPQIDGQMNCTAVPMGNTLQFRLGGWAKKKHFYLVKALADRARQIAHNESIYRSKAIIVPVGEDGNVDTMGFKFLNLEGVKKDDLIFSTDVKEQMQANIFTPLEMTDACREHGIPLKRGVLLAGKYGTGKTLTARVAAKIAAENGWTFLLVQRVAGLRTAIETARIYAPCVVFAEDLDRAVAGDERTVNIDDVLNTIDGIQSKSDDIFVVLTTNHPEKINRAMLRPGRIDAVIEVTPPDPDAVRALLRKYVGSAIASDDPLIKAGDVLAGEIPAVIAEAAKRAKLYAMGRNPDRLVITDDDLAHAARGMGNHLRMLQENAGEADSPALRFTNAMGDLMSQASNRAVTKVLKDAGVIS
jgi:transitional endoplasmic reticulum ATPase